jgi:hypothetical protein
MMLSLKSIEMQVALPRTHEAGKLQEQLQQRGQLQNDFASQSVKKEDDKKKSTVMKQEQKGLTRFSQDGHPNEHHRQGGSKKEKQQKELIEQHPYKGTKVDFSG